MINHPKNYFFASIFFTFFIIFISKSYATDCVVQGEIFSSLNEKQVKILKSVGGTCTKQQSKNKFDQLKYGDKGFIFLNGKKLSYWDLTAEDEINLDGRDVEVYGYFTYYSMKKLEKGYSFGFELDDYESDPTISVRIDGKKGVTSTQEISQKNEKISKNLREASMHSALVKVQGKISAKNGTLFIDGSSLSLVAKQDFDQSSAEEKK
jgi:hypothetical protein